MYASVSPAGFNYYNFTTYVSTSLTNNTLDTRSYGTFVGFISKINQVGNVSIQNSILIHSENPTVSLNSINGICSARVSFPSYDWVSKYSVEIKNVKTGLFGDYFVSQNPSNDAQVLIFALNCNYSSRS